MPRTKTTSDDVLLAAGLEIVHREGPPPSTFATLAAVVDLASSTIVHGSARNPTSCANLLYAWDRLDLRTASAAAHASPDAAGVVDLLVASSGEYEANDHADQLVVPAGTSATRAAQPR